LHRKKERDTIIETERERERERERDLEDGNYGRESKEWVVESRSKVGDASRGFVGHNGATAKSH
jgi:hypothetical protein